MTVALLTNYPTPYRVPLYELLARRDGIEVLCYGGGERYVPSWFQAGLRAGLDDLPFPARPLRGGPREAYWLGRRYDAVIAPYGGGAILPAAYIGARRHETPFILWASVWTQPRSATNLAALPVTRHMYRHANAVVAYGEHVRRFVGRIRGRDADIVVAPQSVEAGLFGRAVSRDQISTFRAEHGLDPGPIVLYVGRLVREKGIAILRDAWARLVASGAHGDATLVVAGDGPLRHVIAPVPHTRVLGPLTREELPVAYAACTGVVLPSIPTPRFREPWGLVCNEAMHQGRPVIATSAVGAVAGGLVRDGVSGLVVTPGDAPALADAIGRLLRDETLRQRLGHGAHAAVAPYTYDATEAAFAQALRIAGVA